ncbi:hypothetical protein [Candidatus Tisiphia endosymbiont of Hybos culiciformis]
MREDRRSTKQSRKATKNGLLRRLMPPRNYTSSLYTYTVIYKILV